MTTYTLAAPAIGTTSPTPSPMEKPLTAPDSTLDANSVGDEEIISKSAGGSLKQVLCLCLPTFVVAFALTVYAPLVNRLKADYDATTVEYNLNITFALVGLALSPLVLSPSLEALGRKRTMLGCWLLFIVFSIGSAFVKNLGGLVVLRFFGFLFGGPLVALFFTSVGVARRRYISISLASTTFLLGLSLGPLVGGLIEAYARGNNRDWSRYMIPIASVVAILPYAIFGTTPISPSTQATVSSSSLGQRIKTQYRTDFKQFITFNTKEPLIIAITLYLSQLYFFFFVTLGAFPYAFGQIRGYGVAPIALTFLSLVIGILLSIGIPQLTRKSTSSKPQPEATLTSLLFCSPLIPIGLFLFSWTASMPDVHWAAPMVGIILFAFGSNAAFIHLNVYLADVYGPHTAPDALACPFVSQCLTASIAPLLTLFMIHRVTFQGSLSILSGVILGLSMIPYLLWWKGDYLRKRSVCAFKG